MEKPIVAIVGRPNVGKSTFVNRIFGQRRAIVDSEAGVTRDRLYLDCEWCGYYFTVVDTGGIIPGEEDEISTSIFEQVDVATKQADTIVFLVDGKDGLSPVDEDIANILRKIDKPVLLVVNKIDTPEKEILKNDFYQLGLGEPHTMSAVQGTGGVGDVLDEIVSTIPKIKEPEETDKIPRLAIVGRPNVGKSSIINFLLKQNRMIVSDKAGTTRDSIDSLVEYNGVKYILTDTAGLRKKSKVEKGIEYYSVKRALDAIRMSDTTILVSDATEGITDQDKKIVEFSNECGNSLLLVINKWDLVEDKDTYTINKFKKDILEELPHGDFADIIFTNAVTGQRLTKLFEFADKAYNNGAKSISTSLLNQVLAEAISLSPPKTVKDKRLRIYYATQVNTNPPVFKLFINKEKLLADNYRRYLENQLRLAFDFTGTPLKIISQEKTERATAKMRRKS